MVELKLLLSNWVQKGADLSVVAQPFTLFPLCLFVRLAGVPVLRALQHLGRGHGLPDPAHGRGPGPDVRGLQGPRTLHGHQQRHRRNAQGWPHASVFHTSDCSDCLSRCNPGHCRRFTALFLFPKRPPIICKLVLFCRRRPRQFQADSPKVFGSSLRAGASHGGRRYLQPPDRFSTGGR